MDMPRRRARHPNGCRFQEAVAFRCHHCQDTVVVMPAGPAHLVGRLHFGIDCQTAEYVLTQRICVSCKAAQELKEG